MGYRNARGELVIEPEDYAAVDALVQAMVPPLEVAPEKKIDAGQERRQTVTQERQRSPR